MATTGATLSGIYERLNSAPEYHPFNADTFSDWSMEAGDMIRVSRDGKDYDSPVHSSTLNWKGQSQISVSSDGNEKRESISKATKKKYGRGGSGYRNDSHLYQELVDDYNGLYSFFEVTVSRMYVNFQGMYDGLTSTFEVTRSRMYVDFQGMYDGLTSTFEVTRSRMYVDFQGMYDGLSSTFEVTRSRMYVDFNNMYEGLSSDFEVTASRMYVSFNGLYDGLSSDFVVTRSQMRAEFRGMYDGLSSTFEVTRSQFYVQLNNTYTNLSSSIQAQAGRIDMVVEGTGENSYIKPAKIQMGIDAATGTSKITLSANNVVIDGSLITSRITADYISAKIESLATLNARDINANTIKAGVNFVLPNGLYLSANGVWQVQLSQSGNNYTLTEMKLNGDTREIGTFSRAVDSWSMGWIGGKFTAKANPQNQSCNTQIVQGEASWSGNGVTIKIDGIDSDNPGYQYYTGRSVYIDASAHYHLTTVTPQGSSVQAYEKLSSGGDIYYKQGTAGTYYQAGSGSVIGRGDSVTAFQQVASGGTIYYKAGSATTYYKAGTSSVVGRGSTVTITQQGSAVSVTKQGSAVTVKKQGSAVTVTKQGTSVSVTKQGTAVSVTPIQATSAIRLGSKTTISGKSYYPVVSSGGTIYYKAGSATTYYRAGTAATYYNAGSSATYYNAGSSATYYNAGSSATYYNAGSNVTYYQGNGGTYTIQGSAVSVTPIQATSAIRINSAATFYKGNGSTVTPQGSAVYITPIAPTTAIRISGEKTFYRAGTAVSDTYYTRDD